MFKELLPVLVLFTGPPKTFEEASTRYGPLRADYTWPQASQWLVPFPFSKYIPNAKDGLVNRDLVIPLIKVFKELEEKGLLKQLKAFYGCYNPRAIAGLNRPSTHAYGTSCDFNPGPFTKEFINVWKQHGWCWGGHFKRKFDPVHFNYGYECP